LVSVARSVPGLIGSVFLAVGSAVVGAVLIRGGIGMIVGRMSRSAFPVDRGIRAN